MATSDQKIFNLKTVKKPAQKAKQDAAERLSRALRDNLHRRKAQARARKSTAAAGKVEQIHEDDRWIFMKIERKTPDKKG